MIWGFSKRARPSPRLIEAWTAVFNETKACHQHVMNEIRASENGGQIGDDVDEARLFAIICTGGITGTLMAHRIPPSEGPKYIDAFGELLTRLINQFPEAGPRDDLKTASEIFAEAAKEILPDIIQKTGVWRNDVDTRMNGAFVFEQLIARYVLRPTARAKYVRVLPGIGSYTERLPVRMYDIYFGMMSRGQDIAST